MSDLMKFTGAKIKQLRNKKRWTQKELADKLDVGKTAIGNYERGEREPGQDILFKLADVFDVSINYFFPTSVDKSDIQEKYDQLDKIGRCKLLEYADYLIDEKDRTKNRKNVVYINSVLSAGTGIVDLDPEYVTEVEYKETVPKHDLAFLVEGQSMEPIFRDGEVVFIEKTEEVRSGQVIAIQINEEAFIKKLHIEDDHMRLVSLNKEYPDIYADKYDNIRVIGRVLF